MKAAGYRVMVVDDDPIVSDSLAAYLEDYDFTVTEMRGGEEALECASKIFFSVAVIDIRLPGMTGETLIEKFAEISPKTCFIICTGLIDYLPTERLKGVGLTTSDIFYKPVNDLGILVRRVKDIISVHGSGFKGYKAE